MTPIPITSANYKTIFSAFFSKRILSFVPSGFMGRIIRNLNELTKKQTN